MCCFTQSIIKKKGNYFLDGVIKNGEMKDEPRGLTLFY